VKFLIVALAGIGGLSMASLETQRRGARLLRGGTGQGLGVLLVTAFSLVLLRLPYLFHDGRALRIALFAPFLASIAWLWPKARPAASRGVLLLYAAYVAMLGIAVIRGADADTYASPSRALVDAIMFVIVALFAMMLLPSARDDEERRRRITAVALAPGIYMAVNVMLHLAGARPPSGGGTSIVAGTPSSLLGYIGIGARRTQFPLGTGINAFGVIAAVGLVGSAVVWRQSRGPLRWVAAACVACSLYGAAYSDTRAAVLAAVVVLALLAVFKRIQAIRLLAIVVPLSPFVVTWLIGGLTSLGIAEYVSRRGNDFSSGTNRFYIWQGALKVLRHFSPDQIIGWGTGGHISSGASLNYAYLFHRLPDPASTPSHNFMIQTVLDTGYIGLALTVTLFAMTLIRLERARREDPGSPVTAVLAMMLVVMIAGLTEALPTTTVGQETLLLTLFGMAFAAQPSLLVATSPALVPEPAWQRSLELDLGRTHTSTGILSM
jgi:O-antigen ligase